MKTFSSLDLQKHTGDVQVAAVRGPVLITHHGKPRAVMMAFDEYRRLCAAAGETTTDESPAAVPAPTGHVENA